MTFLRLLPALALAFCVFSLAACSKKQDAPDPRSEAPTVLVAPVSAAQAASRRLLGVVRAHTESPVSFQVGGKILERYVKNGERVQKGQQLMRLDPQDIELESAAKRAAVHAAQAQYSQAQADLARQNRLVKEGAVSRQAFDQSQQAAQSAAANLKAAQAQAALADNAGKYAVLYAHADGLINSINADIGQVVSAGQTVASLALDGPREIEVSLPEHLDLAIGTVALARSDEASAPAYPTTLTELSQNADPATRSYRARFQLDQGLAQPRLGSSVWLELPLKPGRESLAVPLTSLFDPGSGVGVWIIDADQRVRFVPVQVVRIDSEQAYLSQGPQAGEQIVALGASLLHEGQKIRAQAELAARP